jgi:hypothetical protein
MSDRPSCPYTTSLPPCLSSMTTMEYHTYDLHVEIIKQSSEVVKNFLTTLPFYPCVSAINVVTMESAPPSSTKDFDVRSCFSDTSKRLQILITCYDLLSLTTTACTSLKSLILKDSQLQKYCR